MTRRHIRATAVEHIGKEANRWEERFYLGLNLEAQTEYGITLTPVSKPKKPRASFGNTRSATPTIAKGLP